MNTSCKLRASFLFEVAFVLDFVCRVLCMKNKVTHSVHYITDCMPLLHSHKTNMVLSINVTNVRYLTSLPLLVVCSI
jgi:hypothetical protein